jgi:putative addiction module component (TIGR02574 family)
MSLAELRQLPPAEKLKIIEALWSDLAQKDELVTSPDWHQDELRNTEKEFDAGRIESVDWQKAKKELRQRFE